MKSRVSATTLPRRPYGEPAEIAISRTHIRRHGWDEALHTLLHEMVHQWQAETGRRSIMVRPSAPRPRRSALRRGRRELRSPAPTSLVVTQTTRIAGGTTELTRASKGVEVL